MLYDLLNKQRFRGPGSQSTPGDYHRRVRLFMEQQRADAAALVAGSVELIDLGAAVGGLGGAREQAVKLSASMIRRALRPQDLLVPNDDGSFIVLFHGRPAAEAHALAERIASDVSNVLSQTPATRSFVAQGMALEIEEELALTPVASIDDLVQVFRRAREAHKIKERARVRAASAGDGLSFLPVLNIQSRAIALYEARLTEAATEGKTRDISYAGESPALSAEVSVRAVEGLGALWREADAAPALPLVLLPARSTTLINPLYRANLADALTALGERRRRRVVLALFGFAAGAAGRELAQLVNVLSGLDVRIAVRVGTDESEMSAAAAAHALFVTPVGLLARPAAAAGLDRFAQSARARNLRSLYSGAATVNEAACARTAGFGYVSGPGVMRGFPQPGPRYCLGRLLGA